jgi:hypothetical protein
VEIERKMIGGKVGSGERSRGGEEEKREWVGKWSGERKMEIGSCVVGCENVRKIRGSVVGRGCVRPER